MGVLQSVCTVFSLVAFSLGQSAYAAVTWEQQAERLQNVSATLLDGVPVGEPLTADLSVELKAIISLLPKVDPTVGGKAEKVPSSPMHTIPSLQLNASFLDMSSIKLGAQAWAGYLMPGAESLFGIKAKLSQFGAGVGLVGSYDLGSGSVFANTGFQYSSATLKGGITALTANDSFEAKTTIFYFAPGYLLKEWNVWANALIAFKNTESTFEIPADHTKFHNKDNLSDAKMPFASQIAAGWRHSSGIQVGVAEIYTPDRLLMPRLLLSYQYVLQ